MRKIALFSVLALMIILTGCTSSGINEEKIFDEFSFSVDGYGTCNNKPVVSVFEDGEWQKVYTDFPPVTGPMYVDGLYSPLMGCDLIVCRERSDFDVELGKFVQTGERRHPDSFLHKIPEFVQEPLTGKIKIELDYYSDSNCKNKKHFEQIINK
jgi:hypothetical protein